MKRFQLAQANIARMRAPLDSPVMAEFRAQLDAINALADASPGFVWRIQTEDGDATAIRAFDDALILFNMSVWETTEALHAYVYRSDHVGPMRKRREWFEPMARPAFVLWWIPAGHTPTIAEAKDKLQYLETHGPSAVAFTFRQAFPPPGDAATPVLDVDAEFCQSWTRM